MKSALTFSIAAVLCVSLRLPASDFNVAVQTSNGNSSISVNANANVSFQIVGWLSNSNTDNDGLALWAADLVSDPPCSLSLSPLEVGGGACNDNGSNCNGMACFELPCGINNPAGYGGTQLGNNLLQVGGAQNTIKNTDDYAPAPLGNVVEGVAQSPVVLATGSLTAPSDDGVYTLMVQNVFANVIVDGQISANGEFYRTELAGLGTWESLVITVGTVGVTIASANPPLDNPFVGGVQPFRDVLADRNNANTADRGIGASGTPAEDSVTYASVGVTFSGTPDPAPNTSNITVACTDISGNGAGDCPTVSSVSGSGTGPYDLTLSGIIPRKECMTFTFAGTQTGQRLQYQFLPADVNFSGGVSGTDVLVLVTAINVGSPPPATLDANLARYDINRSGAVSSIDVLRIVQLLNGVNTTQVWQGATVAACP